MDALQNPARTRMLAGELALGVAIRIARTAEIVPACQTAGMDWLFLDLEHGPSSIDTAAQIAITALQAGITPIARVPNGEFSMATRLLDNGALGLVMPHINTAEEAKILVSKLRFPPSGDRSVFGGMPQFGFAPHPVSETSELLNRETLIIAMVETAEAIENSPEIAAVPGIDVLFIGTNDLCAEMKISGPISSSRCRFGLPARYRRLPKKQQMVGYGWALRQCLDGKVHQRWHSVRSDRQRSLIHAFQFETEGLVPQVARASMNRRIVHDF